MSTVQRTWAWYLLPIFFNILGGLFAYFIIRPDDPKKAKECLNIGIVLVAVNIGILLMGLAASASLFSAFDDPAYYDTDDFTMSDAVSLCLIENTDMSAIFGFSDDEAFIRCLQTHGYDITGP